MHLYETIADDIARSILRGQLTPGTRIPSVRHYAGQYEVSVNSVKTAYRLLEDRGLISARPQSGYYVRDSLPELCHLQESSVNSRESAVPLSGLNRLLSVILENQLRGDCIDLALACPSGDRFYPAGRLKKITAQLLRSASGFSTTYAMPPGSPRLRSQIARRGLHTGMILSPDDVIITHGTMEAISLAVRASTLPGDTVAVESPTF